MLIRFIAAFVFTLALFASLSASAAPPQMNFILIVADDLGGADLGCYGSTYHRTPNLDQLAKDGMRFTQAYSACPVCSPTRASLMTGKYPARLHLTDWLPGRPDRPDQRLARPMFRQQLPLDEVTVAEVLHSAGYATGHIGKWHLGGEGFEPQRQGFDLNIAGDHTGTPLSYFAPFRRMDRKMAGLDDAPEGQYLTDRLAEEAGKFLEPHRDKPFFLYLPHFAVHTPLQAPPARVAKFAANQPAGKQGNPIYAAMLEALDDAVGRVRKKLADLSLADRTVIVFTSDNGGLATREGPSTPATNNSPFREGKGWLYEGGIRVPLLVVWPGVTEPGAVCDIPVFSGDISPTLLEIAGTKFPHDVDGMSFVNQLKGGPTLRTRALFWHYPHYSNQGGKPGGAVREGNWKLIEFYETGRRELFDLQSEPGESRNVAAEHPDKVDTLGKRLASWRESVGAQTMQPNPGYVPNPPDKTGKIVLHARTAQLHGSMLRFEPLPHKDTLGYWVRAEDYATFEFTVEKPGTFTLEILQGCGTGQGGSVVEFSIGDQSLTHTVVDTGGFQEFKTFRLGEVRLDTPGRMTLTVKPRSKSKAAVMDLRQVTLTPKSE